MTTTRRTSTTSKTSKGGRQAAGPGKAPARPVAASRAVLSPKAFAAALARIDALERQVARLAALPIQIGPSGDVTIEAGAVLRLRAPTVALEASASLEAQASQLSVATGMARVDTGLVRFSGVVVCDTLQSTTVIASSYSPGAGNLL